MSEKTIGELIDNLYTCRQDKADINKALKEVASKEKAITDEILSHLGEQDIEGARGKLAQVSILDKEIPIVEDMEKTLAWMEEDLENRFVFQRRLAVRTVAEMWENGDVIPGLNKMHQTKLSLRKV